MKALNEVLTASWEMWLRCPKGTLQCQSCLVGREWGPRQVMLLKWQKLASDVTQVGYINTLEIGRKAYLLDYFLKEEEIWSFFSFTKAHSGEMHGVLLGAQLQSPLHGCWLPVILSRLGCHPDTGDAESVHLAQQPCPLEACTVAWCRLKEAHLGCTVSTCHYCGSLRC